MDTVLDLSSFLHVELKSDNVQAFDTTWDETIIAMTKTDDKDHLVFVKVLFFLSQR